MSTPLVAFAISLAARAQDRASEGREAASEQSGTVEQEGHEWMNELIWGGFSVCLNAKEKVLHS